MSPILYGPSATDHMLRRATTPYAMLAPLYDPLIGARFFPQLRGTFERLVRRYGVCGDSAADIACGTGAFVRYLRRRGVPLVYGVDRSPEMLRVAIARNQGNGARFLLQDFATLRLPRPVDLITCNFDSLNYLLADGDLLRALCHFHANLKPHGYAIFDMITDRPLWPGRRPYVERVTGPGFIFERIMRRDPRRGIQTSLVSISRAGRSQQEIHVQRGYPVATVASLLSQAQLELLGAHNFQTLGAATPWTSRAVYAAQKV